MSDLVWRSPTEGLDDSPSIQKEDCQTLLSRSISKACERQDTSFQMTLDDFRRDFEAVRYRLAVAADQSKVPMAGLFALFDVYRQLDESNRVLANQIVSEWTLSHDELHRYDAVSLIREFNIAVALPALEQLAARLIHEQTVGAPFELEKVKDVIAHLAWPKTL